MSRFLQQILGVPEPMFSHGLKQLEKATGNSGVDTRLIADITEKAHKIMRKLNLDTRDTTGKELYLTLISAVKNGSIEKLLLESDYVLFMINGQIISFNMVDLIDNSHHEMPYDRQIVSHGQRSLCGELIGRYINHTRTNDDTVREVASFIGLVIDDDK